MINKGASIEPPPKMVRVDELETSIKKISERTLRKATLGKAIHYTTLHIEVKAIHVLGKHNGLADANSRNNLSVLSSQVPEAAANQEVANEGTTGFDIGNLVPTVRELFSAGIAKSIQRTYKSGSKRYVDFCCKFGLTPFPSMETYFMAFLYNEGLSAGTVKSYLSAARYTQISLGLKDLNVAGMPQLEFVVKGLKKRTATRQSQVRLPITPEILRALKKVWEGDADREKAVMLWAAVCMCFFGFLCSGEVVVPTDSEYDKTVHLPYGDVRVDSTVNPQYLEVRIKESKTDPFRKGVTGRADGDLCPVSAVLAYMVQRGPDKSPFFWFTKD